MPAETPVKRVVAFFDGQNATTVPEPALLPSFLDARIVPSGFSGSADTEPLGLVGRRLQRACGASWRGITVASIDPGIDESLAMYQSGQISHFDVDGLGSVVATNDTAGNVTHSVVFDAWGNARAETGTRTHPFTYTGREVGEAGLLFYRPSRRSGGLPGQSRRSRLGRRLSRP